MRYSSKCTSMDGASNSKDEKEGDSCVRTAGQSSGRLESELENVCRELSLVDARVAELLDQQSSLCRRRDQLSVEIQARKKRRESQPLLACDSCALE